VPNGAIYGLIGPNGAGKTTLIDQIFGMGSPDAGTIRVCGLDHERDEVAVKERAAYVGPDLNFAAWGRVAKAIRFVRGFPADMGRRVLRAADAGLRPRSE
jgi:ABC-2 type transport system ATP-binding protein